MFMSAENARFHHGMPGQPSESVFRAPRQEMLLAKNRRVLSRTKKSCSVLLTTRRDFAQYAESDRDAARGTEDSEKKYGLAPRSLLADQHRGAIPASCSSDPCWH